MDVHKAIIDAYLRGIDLPEGAHVVVFDVLPNRLN